MYLKSLKDCRLIIGSYPPFKYNATGGGGEATISANNKENILNLSFNSKTFSIPSLNWKTTRFLFLPLPPGLKIKMCMDKLEGTLNQTSGEILLRFESRFIFTIGPIFRSPDLIIKTSLKTGKVKGALYEEEGLNLQSDGRARLVGVSEVPATENKLLNMFLGLPNEAFAELKCEIK